MNLTIQNDKMLEKRGYQEVFKKSNKMTIFKDTYYAGATRPAGRYNGK
jgi:hypothetical protein